MNDTATSSARPKRPPSRLPDAKTGQSSSVDRMLATFGVLIALSSLGFAGYMISDVDRPPRIAGLEYLSIFARPSHGLTAAAGRQDAEEAPGRLAQSIDPTPTGSIPDKSGAVRARPSNFPFKVLYVAGGEALMQADGAILHVKVGDALPTLGRINSIEKTGDRWIVTTQSGATLEWPPLSSAGADATAPKK
jgi:hypothetical protein